MKNYEWQHRGVKVNVTKILCGDYHLWFLSIDITAGAVERGIESIAYQIDNKYIYEPGSVVKYFIGADCGVPSTAHVLVKIDGGAFYAIDSVLIYAGVVIDRILKLGEKND